jgi:hypothetical protein
MRRTFLLGLTLAAAEVVLISGPLWAATVRPVAVIGGIAALIVAAFLFSGRGTWREFVPPVAIATAIVAAWTAFRVVVMHDPDVIRIALAIQGFVIVLVAMLALMALLQRRGWITYSTARRRVVFAGLFASGFVLLLGLPAEPWNTRLRVILTTISVAAIFWPAGGERREQPSSA